MVRAHQSWYVPTLVCSTPLIGGTTERGYNGQETTSTTYS